MDAEKLIAEIERRIDLICTTEGVVQRDKLQEYEALRDVEDFITSLQQEQPEVELEKEITEHAENMPHGEFTHDSECREHEEWAMKEFRYFYELGLNAKKEE